MKSKKVKKPRNWTPGDSLGQQIYQALMGSPYVLTIDDLAATLGESAATLRPVLQSMLEAELIEGTDDDEPTYATYTIDNDAQSLLAGLTIRDLYQLQEVLTETIDALDHLEVPQEPATEPTA